MGFSSFVSCSLLSRTHKSKRLMTKIPWLRIECETLTFLSASSRYQTFYLRVHFSLSDPWVSLQQQRHVFCFPLRLVSALSAELHCSLHNLLVALPFISCLHQLPISHFSLHPMINMTCPEVYWNFSVLGELGEQWKRDGRGARAGCFLNNFSYFR